MLSQIGLIAQQIVDKLLCGTAGDAAVADLPFVGFGQQLFVAKGDAVVTGQTDDDVIKLSAVRL